MRDGVERGRLDRIGLHGLRAFGYHGVYPEERKLGQRFVVDVTLGVDTRAAAAGDDLTASVDYGVVAERVVAVVEGEPVDLIETLAQRIAGVCLADARVEEVMVTVHKPGAPVTVPFDDVTVTIVRSASEREARQP
jgi:dihydroneopterin aldolase